MVWYYRNTHTHTMHNAKVFHQSEFWCWKYDRFHFDWFAVVKDCRVFDVWINYFLLEFPRTHCGDIGFLENQNQVFKAHKGIERILRGILFLLAWVLFDSVAVESINSFIRSNHPVHNLYIIHQKFVMNKKNF